MFKDKTLFVIGAGASVEFGLPVGRDLAEEIRKKSSFTFPAHSSPRGDEEVLNLLRQNRSPTEQSELFRACSENHNGIYMAGSIDSFIDRRSDVSRIAEVGKLLIAISILRAERKSNLYLNTNIADPRIDLPTLGNTWIDRFFRILTTNIKKDEIEKIGEEIAIICFNYDRCLEFYLIDALRQSYSIAYQESHKIIYNMDIIHPYGSLGELPENPAISSGGETVRFGGDDFSRTNPWPVSNRIKTYTEQIAEQNMLIRIENAVRDAKQIVFLGFSFQPQNMELLAVGEKLSIDKHVFATGKGVTRHGINEIKSRILSLYAGGEELNKKWMDFVNIDSGTECNDLLIDHFLNLSAA